MVVTLEKIYYLSNLRVTALIRHTTAAVHRNSCGGRKKKMKKRKKKMSRNKKNQNTNGSQMKPIMQHGSKQKKQSQAKDAYPEASDLFHLRRIP